MSKSIREMGYDERRRFFQERENQKNGAPQSQMYLLKFSPPRDGRDTRPPLFIYVSLLPWRSL